MKYERGRFRAEKIIVRKLSAIEIIFLDKQTICVFPTKGLGSGTQFHRWFAELGSYDGGWRQFRDRMLKYKNLTYLKCFELAAQFDIESVSARGHPDLSSDEIEIRD